MTTRNTQGAKTVLAELEKCADWYIDEATWVAALRDRGYNDIGSKIEKLVRGGQVIRWQQWNGADCPGMYRTK